ncbi:hypothetical protein CspHIS471_0307440 [Cutaneotrichosporon sp. HIS471]|nr:hypothetical protein CspHIS471_0307440 [Cutaneotrichosporon sp. HIS471]
MPATNRVRKKCKRRKLPDLPMHLRPPLDAMDMDARLMISRYYPTSHTPSPQFLRDARLRTFARALLVVCLELNAPGTMRWWMCEPIAFYHRLIPAYWEYDHTHLQATFHRLVGVFKRRVAYLWRQDVRVARGGKMSRLRTVLERALWEAPNLNLEGMRRRKHLCSFLRSCALDVRNAKLFWPLPVPATFIDPAQVPALHAKFAVKGAPLPDLTRVQAHPDEDTLERMESRDEESEVEVIEVDDSDEESEVEVIEVHDSDKGSKD